MSRKSNPNDLEVLQTALSMRERAEAWQKEIMERQQERENEIYSKIGEIVTAPETTNKPSKKAGTSDAEKQKLYIELQTQNQKMQEKIEQQQKDFQQKQKILLFYKTLLEENKAAVHDLKQKHQMARQNCEFKIEECAIHSKQHEDRLQTLNTEISDLFSKKAYLKLIFEQKHNEELKQKEKENSILEANAKVLADISHCNDFISELKMKIESTQKRILLANSRDQELFEFRKYRHNLLQELKGNIRVYCRVRPVVSTTDPKEIATNILSNVSIEIGGSASILPGNGAEKVRKAERFDLDKIFRMETTQAEIFSEVSAFIKSALDGYNVCIFAYGQTGSGKTHTMEGKLSDPIQYGIIPRSVEQIFSATKDMEKWGWIFQLQVSFQEIYNEKLIDLLCKDNKVAQNTSMHSYQPTQRTVASPEELFALVHLAAVNRTTAQTEYNMTSSRSHSIFQIKICGKNSETSQTHESLLNLIDLAGSESLDATAGHGKEREKETKSINKSLSALKGVIAALAERRDHIPTRNSKLTYLLKDSLGGNCKTLMFVNISPLSRNLHQTVQSLRFASKVNSCYIGLAKKT